MRGRRRSPAAARWHRALVGVALALGSLVGCQPDQPQPSPSASVEPSAPTLRAASTSTYTFDGRAWSFRAVLDPHGLPTRVILEYGSPADPAAHEVVVGKAIDDPGEIEARLDPAAAGASFCGRFVATNSTGQATLDVGCHESPVLPPASAG